ncbi:hypothetical protein HHK36_003676 [Tetracentron sinense]|uniref:Uncharacterized protein n=1 Tax=Tetracentron sinense TaxID=13715 RepID=A0A835DSQ6_TETSI|nr:hypothetical protein HHK36_003676 [Tetracentron sinense]
MEGAKGTVTSLASIFPVEDAQKAAKHVHDTIADRQTELDSVNGYIADNTNLVNLVQRLPDELSHEVMARHKVIGLFLVLSKVWIYLQVLLGEGYYVERTSKQTIEILQRRGNILDSQVDSLKAMLLNLKAEASFFDATAAEAAEGLVEIREDYIEENSTERLSNQAGLSEEDTLEVSAEGDEYARIMSRLDELEQEELAAESLNKEDEDEEAEDNFGCSTSQHSFDHCMTSSEDHQLRNLLQQSKDKSTSAKKSLNENHTQQNLAAQSTFGGLMVHRVPKDESSRGKNLAYNVNEPNPMEKPLLFPESKEKVQSGHISEIEVSEDNSTGRPSKTGTDSYKACFLHVPICDHVQAFTGSIIEHTRSIQTNPVGQTAASSQLTESRPSKPVSRFKMQKGSR